MLFRSHSLTKSIMYVAKQQKMMIYSPLLIRKLQNINQVSKQMRPYRIEIEQSEDPIIIGYYPFRAKAQLCRLLCQYLHIKYVDKLFTPQEWLKYKENEAKDWIIKDLPFIKDQDFTVTGTSAIIHYILTKFGRKDMLGRNLADQIKIDSIRSKHDLRNAILGLICRARLSITKQQRKDLNVYWATKIQPIFYDYQKECPDGGWYHGYLTMMDFVIYQLLNQTNQIFPEKLSKFIKLVALRNRFSNITQIRNYQKSSHAIKEYSPVEFFDKYKQQMRNNRNSSVNSSGNPTEKLKSQMDLE